MSDFKGEPRDTKWPYHVAVPAKLSQGTDFLALIEFCKGIKICDICYTVRRNEVEYIVYAFADRWEAEQFCAHFDGEFMEPG